MEVKRVYYNDDGILTPGHLMKRRFRKPVFYPFDKKCGFDYEIMRENISMENLEHRMIKYQLHQDEGEYSDFIIYLNPSPDSFDVEIEDKYKIIYHSENNQIIDGKVTISGVSFVIVAR